MTALYRSTLEVARTELTEAWDRETSRLTAAAPLAHLLARRVGRIAQGAVLLMSAVAMGLTMSGLCPHSFSPTAILAFAFPLAVTTRALTEALTRVLGARQLGRRARRIALKRADASLDPFAALDELRSQSSPIDDLATRLARRETASVLLPLVGICALGPLTVHLAVYALTLLPSLVSGGAGDGLAGFDSWIGFSLLFVGLAHLAVLVYCAWYVVQLRLRSREQAPSPFRPVLVATIVSGFPSVLFVPFGGLGLLPVAITFATGMVLLPVVFSRATRFFHDERLTIERAQETGSWQQASMLWPSGSNTKAP